MSDDQNDGGGRLSGVGEQVRAADDESPKVESATNGESAEEPTSEEDPRSSPAFEYDADLQRAAYVRDETWERLEELAADAAYVLRKEHGLSDVPKRELHDAVLSAALGDVSDERLAGQVLALRDEQNSDD